MDQSPLGQDPEPAPTQPQDVHRWAPPLENQIAWSDSPPPPAPPPQRWSPFGAIIAWVLILVMTIGAFVANIISKEPAGANEKDRVGVVMMELQGKYMTGAASLQGQGGILLSAAERSLNKGSVDQRQRMVILAGELGGDDAAIQTLSKLNDLILAEQSASQPDVPPFAVTADQQRVQNILNAIYLQPVALPQVELDESTRAERIESLSDADRQFLIDNLGWFGKLALAPPGDSTDRALRDEVIASARTVFIILIGVVVAACAGGLVGLAGLILLLVFAIRGRVRSGLGPPVSHHGVYAETFAVWMLVFFGIQKGLSFVAGFAQGFTMTLVVGGFFVSLLALLWPVIRGVSWRQVRQDIGWTLGRRPALEPLTGLGGYLMALPILGIGVCITLALVLIQEAIKGEGPTFGPAGGPAHPIIEQLGGPGLWPKIQILLLASVAAPIVEETMFRGVLYRHLRDATRGWGTAGSVLCAGTINAFLFAAIHPQGWVAIPALMSLAYAFVIVREWRGTLIPAMIIHGVSNGIVMTTLMVLLSA